MDRRKLLLMSAVLCFWGIGFEIAVFGANTADMSEVLKESLVHLSISKHGYEQMQPWKRSDILEDYGFGCAVGPYEVLTTAANVANAAFIKARRYGQNEFIPATIKVVDYESNLCLLELDKDAMSGPLKALKFSERFDKGAELGSYWLSGGGHLTTGRGYLDRGVVRMSVTSFAKFLSYIVVNTSKSTASGEIYYLGDKAVGIACVANNKAKQSRLIPGEVINKFLDDTRGGEYAGFAVAGFAIKSLLDPAMRTYLKMPAKMKTGVYVNKVYELGTGSEELKQGDVLLAIDGQELNAYGRYLHDKYDRIFYHHLFLQHDIGDAVRMEVWRDGKKEVLKAAAKGISSAEMLVPYYEFDRQPEYLVTGGFVFQKLTRNFLKLWGEGWTGNAPPHLFHYFRDLAFAPSEERREIVLLSFVLPVPVNQGYQRLGRLVVNKVNGEEIGSFDDFVAALDEQPESPYHVIEFEHDHPTVVIPRQGLAQMNSLIEKNYGISKNSNIVP